MIFVDNLNEPETPRLLPDGSWLLVEMVPPGSVTWISRDGKTIQRLAEVERPNGLAIDHQQTIWVAATHPVPALLRISRDGGTSEVVSTGEKDEPFLFPNDLCFGPDGFLYMTDSGILMDDWERDGKLRPDYLTAPFDGRVYQIDTSSNTLRILDRGFKFTNGIAIGLDGDLYVNEMITGDVFRYSLGTDGSVGPRVLVGNVMAPEWGDGGFRGPDGMAFGADGRIYCTVFGQSDVTVLGSDGEQAERIALQGRFPTNVSFGPDNEPAIYVTEKEHGRIEKFDAPCPGAPVYHGT